jgi:hypothetical protein
MVFLVLPVAALMLGGSVLRPLGLKRDAAGLIARFNAGLFVCGLLILAFGGVKLTLATWAITIVAAAGLTHEVFFRKKRAAHAAAEEHTAEPRGFPYGLGLAAFLAGALLAIVPCLSLATDLEVVTGPLAAAKDYDALGRMVPYEGADAPSYASLAQCLYTWAYATGSEADARLMSWLFTLFAASALYALTEQSAGRCAGAVAAGAFAATPLFLDRATAVSGDMLAAGLILASLAALAAWQKERRLAWLVLAGIFMGSAWDGSPVVAIVCCGGVLLAAGVAKYERIPCAVVFATAMAAAAAPWVLARAVSGAPFTILAGDLQTAPETGLAAFLKYPWNLIMRPHWYGGWETAPGGLLLILGIPGFIVGSRYVRWLGVFVVVSGIALYVVDRSHVSFLPLAAILLAVAAVGACKLETLRPLISVALTALFLQGLLANAWLAFAPAGEKQLQSTPRYEAVNWVNENLPKGNRILTPEPYHYFFDMPTYRNLEVVARMKGANDTTLRKWLHENRIAYFVFPETWVRAHRRAIPEAALDAFDRWRANDAVFNRIQVLRVPTPGGEGVEQVEIYEVRNGRGGDS